MSRLEHSFDRIGYFGIQGSSPTYQGKHDRLFRLYRYVLPLSPSSSALDVEELKGSETYEFVRSQANPSRKLSPFALSDRLRVPLITVSLGLNLTSSRKETFSSNRILSYLRPSQPKLIFLNVSHLPVMGNSQLFGADDESDQQELDDAEKNGENGSSILPSLLFPLFVDPVELHSAIVGCHQ